MADELTCPWCSKPPRWQYGATPQHEYGVSLECDDPDCPAPDDAKTLETWMYVRDEVTALKRWNMAAIADEAKSKR